MKETFSFLLIAFSITKIILCMYSAENVKDSFVFPSESASFQIFFIWLSLFSFWDNALLRIGESGAGFSYIQGKVRFI